MIRGTWFPDASAQSCRPFEVTWQKFVASLAEAGVAEKESAPLIKLAGFGDQRTGRGSLRHDRNVTEVYGLEGDYDAGQVSPEEAVERLERHNLRAVVVTTHRHRPDSPRWRVYAPLGAPIPPSRRADYVAALNGALGGILAPESFRLSQSYYVGRSAGQSYVSLATFEDASEGYTLDELDPAERDALAVWPQDRSFVPQLEDEGEAMAPSRGLPDLVQEMLEHVSADDYIDWVRIGMALHYCDAEKGFRIWDEWSAKSSKYAGPDATRQKWASFSDTRASGWNAGTIVRMAREGGYQGPSWSPRETRERIAESGVDLSGFRLPTAPKTDALPMFAPLSLLASRPELLAPPEALVPKLVWRGRTTGIIAPDKAGKSTLMGHAVAAVTNGEPLFGELVKQGTALIVAPDEAVGDTVRRLLELGAHLERTRILTMHPRDLLEQLRQELERETPDLLVVDSLAEWARLVAGRAPDDGDAAGWGAVVRPLVQLSRDFGVGIALLHHPRRSDGQYRGSGEIAAALDCLLEIQMPKAGEDETLRRFSGRARWPIAPFELVLHDGQYQAPDAVEIPIQNRILIDLQVAGPSSRNEQHRRIGGRKMHYLQTVTRLLNDGRLQEIDGKIAIVDNVENSPDLQR